jgi:hypothetical protein
MGIAGAILAACVASIVYALAKIDSDAFVMPMYAGLLGGIGAGGALGILAGKRIVGEEQTLSIDEREVRLGDTHLAFRDRITRALVVPSAYFTVLRLERGGLSPIEVHVPTAADGRAALAKLGFDVGHRTMRFVADRTSLFDPALGQVLLFLGGLAAGFGAVETRSPVFAVMAVALMVLSFASPLFALSHVDVGPDGVRIRAGWRSVYLPIEDIDSVQTEQGPQGSAVLVACRKAKVAHRISFGSKDSGVSGSRAEALYERIHEAMELARGREKPAFDPQLLARDGRSVAEWVRALRELAGKQHTFRELGVSAEALLRAVEDPSASPLTRIAAAAALAPHAEREAKSRIAAAAGAAVAPRLRVALEAAATDDVDRVTEVLAELDGKKG